MLRNAIELLPGGLNIRPRPAQTGRGRQSCATGSAKPNWPVRDVRCKPACALGAAVRFDHLFVVEEDPAWMVSDALDVCNVVAAVDRRALVGDERLEPVLRRKVGVARRKSWFGCAACRLVGIARVVEEPLDGPFRVAALIRTYEPQDKPVSEARTVSTSARRACAVVKPMSTRESSA